jgi:hypothetical protein
LATTTPFLDRVPSLVIRGSGPLRPFELAIVGTLGAYPASERGQVNLVHQNAGPLDKVIQQAHLRSPAEFGGPPRQALLSYLNTPSGTADVLAEAVREYRGPEDELDGVLLYLTSPDPLDLLVDRVVGIVENPGK